MQHGSQQVSVLTAQSDDANSKETRTDGAGNVARLRYDGEGLLLEKTDPKGAAYKTTYDYNTLRSIKQVTDAKGGSWGCN
jgi:YD repeat-containing protein